QKPLAGSWSGYRTGRTAASSHIGWRAPAMCPSATTPPTMASGRSRASARSSTPKPSCACATGSPQCSGGRGVSLVSEVSENPMHPIPPQSASSRAGNRKDEGEGQFGCIGFSLTSPTSPPPQCRARLAKRRRACGNDGGEILLRNYEDLLG